jgi:hypothetical protein
VKEMARRKLKENEIVINTIVDRELWDKVGEVAKKNGTTKQEVLKKALDFYSNTQLQKN